MSNCFKVELAELGNYVIVMVKRDFFFWLYLPNAALNSTSRTTMKQDIHISFSPKNLGALTWNKRLLSEQLTKLHEYLNK